MADAVEMFDWGDDALEDRCLDLQGKVSACLEAKERSSLDSTDICDTVVDDRACG